MEPLTFREMKTLYGWRMSAVVHFAVFHALAIAAFWWYSLSAMIIAVVLYLLVGLGVTIGFHRLLTHNSFETFSWMRRFFAVLGSLAVQSSPLIWVAMHRAHHQYTEGPKDPHSPKYGFWWAHWFWILVAVPREELQRYCKKYVPDLLKDPFISRISIGMTILFQIALGALLALGGWFFGGFDLAVSWVLWGVFLRVTVGLHLTWFINSATHWWGYRNYNTADWSTNNWLFGFLSWGEGWHNNHHKFPKAPNHGFQRWWEVDFSYCVILALTWSRLAWNAKYQPYEPKEEPQLATKS